jgi:hypothetical protein
MMHLYTESKELAAQALAECEGDFDAARDMLHEICDSHEVAIYSYKAIKFCAEQNTNDGEAYLEDCGGIVQPGDSFGNIACRIAYATLYVAACDALAELERGAE